MVKFSQELSKIVLPLNKSGSHLNSKGETINPELKKKNFMHVTQILAEIWLGMIIDSHPVLAEYINEDVEEEILKKSIDRKRNHIWESQYSLQIVKIWRKNAVNYSIQII